MKQIRNYKTKFCEECGLNEIRATPSAIRCLDCKKKKDIEKAIRRQETNLSKGLCRCGRSLGAFKICEGCRNSRKRTAIKRIDKTRVKNKEYRVKLKKQVFTAYGNACSCCSEAHFEFLEIDHVGGWGKDHRDAGGGRTSGTKLLNFIIKEQFPPTFRLLCGNCHLSISYHGYCPHEKEHLSK